MLVALFTFPLLFSLCLPCIIFFSTALVSARGLAGGLVGSDLHRVPVALLIRGGATVLVT